MKATLTIKEEMWEYEHEVTVCIEEDIPLMEIEFEHTDEQIAMQKEEVKKVRYLIIDSLVDAAKKALELINADPEEELDIRPDIPPYKSYCLECNREYMHSMRAICDCGGKVISYAALVEPIVNMWYDMINTVSSEILREEYSVPNGKAHVRKVNLKEIDFIVDSHDATFRLPNEIFSKIYNIYESED